MLGAAPGASDWQESKCSEDGDDRPALNPKGAVEVGAKGCDIGLVSARSFRGRREVRQGRPSWRGRHGRCRRRLAIVLRVLRLVPARTRWPLRSRAAASGSKAVASKAVLRWPCGGQDNRRCAIVLLKPCGYPRIPIPPLWSKRATMPASRACSRRLVGVRGAGFAGRRYRQRISANAGDVAERFVQRCCFSPTTLPRVERFGLGGFGAPLMRNGYVFPTARATWREGPWRPDGLSRRYCVEWPGVDAVAGPSTPST